MKALRFDFAHPRPRFAPLSWCLLLLGLAGAGMALAEYLAVQAQWRQTQEHLSAQSANAPRTPRTAARPAGSPAPHRAAERAMAALATPWGPLLRGMEALAPQGVALLAMEASAAGSASRASSLRLIGEAREVDDAVAYVEALRTVPTVRSAELAHHERRLVDGAELLRFSISIDWGAPAP